MILRRSVEQLQVHRSLGIILEKGIAALLALAEKAKEYRNLPVTARSLAVPAQLTTLGKRMANWGEELERSLESLTRMCAAYPYRGLKGAVGTRLDQVTLFWRRRQSSETRSKGHGASGGSRELGKRRTGLSAKFGF